MFEHLDKLQALEDRYIDLEAKISDPSVISDQAQWQKYTKAHAKLTDVVETYRAYQKLQKTYDDDQALLEMGESDEELAAMAEMEMKELAPQLEDYEKRLTILLLPKDPNDEKNIIMEIRAGAGGDEAALFAGDLFRMYTRYAETKGWRVELMDSSPTGLGGFKEVIFMVSGSDVYSHMKFESGVHRVQRVPETEAQGRIHTSTATVAVMPEAEEVDVDIKMSDRPFPFQRDRFNDYSLYPKVGLRYTWRFVGVEFDYRCYFSVRGLDNYSEQFSDLPREVDYDTHIDHAFRCGVYFLF